MTKMFMLALLCLFGTAMVDAKLYDMSVSLLMNDESGCNKADSKAITELIETVFSSVGVVEAGNSGKWKVSKNGKETGQKAPGDDFRRDLQWLSCQQAAIMCQMGATWYCNHCCGCGNGRRRLRSELAAVEIEERAAPLLAKGIQDTEISCLNKDEPNNLEVLILERS